MKPRDLLRLVWSNLNRMRGRAIMTAMGVLIGTAAIVVLIALASGLRENSIGSMDQFGPLNQITVMPGAFFRVFGGGSVTTTSEEGGRLTPRALERIAQMEGVDAVTPYEQLVFPVTLKLNRLIGSATLTGISRYAVRDLNMEMAQGTGALGNWTVIVGSKVGESFVDPRRRTSMASGEAIDLYGQTLTVQMTRPGEDGRPVTRTVRLRVGGVLAPRGGSDDYAIFMSLEDADDLTAWYTGQRPNRRIDGYSQAIVVVNDPALELRVEQQLLEDGYFAFSARSTLQQINILFGVIQGVFGGIGAIALIVAAIGIANTMIMSILERTREIGLMKAVGATNRDVMLVFISEAGAIGLLGGIGGIIFGVVAAKIIDLIAQAYINAQIATSGATASEPISIAVIPLWLLVFAVVFSLIVGLASGIYPALRAVQLNPVTALKYE
jgi:putative ABC transport system permease protein